MAVVIEPGRSSRAAPAPRTNGSQPEGERRELVVAAAGPVLATGLATCLDGARPGWQVVGVALDRTRLLQGMRFDLSLVVAGACIGDVSAIAKALRSISCIPLLVLAHDLDASHEADLLRGGAAAALPVGTPRDRLVRVAGELMSGRSVASADAMRLLATGWASRRFTERQTQVLRLLSEGRSTAEMARAMVLTESTVKTHIGRLVVRLGLSGRRELEARAPALLAHAKEP